MEKEIFIKKFIDSDEEFDFISEGHHGRGDGMRVHKHISKGRGSGNGFGRSDKGRGNHLNGGRRDGVGPHFEEGCNTGVKKHRSIRIERFDSKMKTKMFTNKKDLVEYVNKVGELGNKVDIYKIEDDLYKVVVIEMQTEEPKEEKVQKETK